MSEIDFLKSAHITVKTLPLGKSYIEIEASELGESLAKILGEYKLENGHYLIEYTVSVDKRVVDLIDALIAIRYAHPLLMQLSLDISGWSK